MAKCCISDCTASRIMARGMCSTHYKRWYRYGDPSITKKAFRHLSNVCSVKGCDLATLARGLCQNHYAINRRWGDPAKRRTFVGEYIKDGYRYILVGNRHYEPQHRLVMERHLGRALTPDEHIHHEDEDTLNNSLDNLKIVSRSEHLSIHVQERPRGYRGRFVPS